MIMMESFIMAARPVQIWLDRDLLARIDRDPQAKKDGRSALIRDAVTLYLEAKRRKKIDAQIRRAYQGHGRELLDEVEQLLEEQAWPEG
jgi:metal-responsive CopG/Arc/MetJ family transcriptional regulator